jgi:aryl-alcohol dehydrogenase-like predicted oxidoreductase
MKQRKLGDWEVSPLGMGCWAIGGPFWAGDEPLGWGEVDDNESIKAIHAGIEAGINVMDTADLYGCGHSEVVIGKALKGKRDQVILATKFGGTFEEDSKQCTGQDASPTYIESAVNASLKRLDTDVIDLLWFHINDYPVDQADLVADTLETLVSKGKIQKFGWSTDFPDRAEVFAKYQNCAAFQFDFNVIKPSEMLSFVEKHNYAGVNRGPLAMGLLSGKYSTADQLSESDIRRISPDWMTYFKDGVPAPELIEKFNAIREVLTSEGRSSVQGALAWIWGKSELTIPIPGFRTVDQIQETASAMSFGALTPDQMKEVERLLT